MVNSSRGTVGLTAIVAAAAVAMTLTSACQHSAPPPRPAYAIYSTAEPPEPYLEVTPESPGPDFVWIDGYWHWNGSEYVWVRGYWAVRPYADYIWVRSGWVFIDGGYRFVPGRWAHRGRAPSIYYYRTRPAPVRGPVYRTRSPNSGGTVRPKR